MKEILKECDMCGEQNTQVLHLEQEQEDHYIRSIKIPGIARGKGMRLDLCPKHHRDLITYLVKWVNRMPELTKFIAEEEVEAEEEAVSSDSESEDEAEAATA